MLYDKASEPAITTERKLQTMLTPCPDFQQIYDNFYPQVLHYLTNLLGEDEAEDLTQVVFLKVNEGLTDFRGEAKLSTWIYRIATNTAVSRTRSCSYRDGRALDPEAAEVDATEDINMWTGETPPDVDQTLVRREISDCIRSVVEQLPENYRAVIVLSEYEGMRNSEICDILNLSLDTVKIRIHRARKKLREALEHQCDFYRDERNELACDPKGCS